MPMHINTRFYVRNFRMKASRLVSEGQNESSSEARRLRLRQVLCLDRADGKGFFGHVQRPETSQHAPRQTNTQVEESPAFGGRGACAARIRLSAHRGIEAIDSVVLSGSIPGRRKRRPSVFLSLCHARTSLRSLRIMTWSPAVMVAKIHDQGTSVVIV